MIVIILNILWAFVCFDEFIMCIVSSTDRQCTVNMEGGKLVCKTGKVCHIQELKGGEMIEVKSIFTRIHTSTNI